VLDLGTGDGRAVLARARREPRALVLGIDASASAMAESSLRAARPPRKGGLPNALFLVAAAESLPEPLRGRIDELTILFPWGSLLRAALALDDARPAAGSIAGLLAPAGRLGILVSVDDRDRLDVGPLTVDGAVAVAERWTAHGLTVTGAGLAGEEQVAASGSTWARRLGAGRRRTVWRIELQRSGEGRGGEGRSGTRPASITSSRALANRR
jgi:16S rRNA (adenine(1408)-N(1))-methyltransferase